MKAPPYTKKFHELAELHRIWDQLVFPWTLQRDGRIEVWIATGSQAWDYARYQYREIPPHWAARTGWGSAADFRRWRCKPMTVCPQPDSPLQFRWSALIRSWMYFIILDTDEKSAHGYIETLALALADAGAVLPMSYIPGFGHRPEVIYDV